MTTKTNKKLKDKVAAMHELKTCSVCGATELKRIGTEEHDGQVYGIYQCASCDTELSAYKVYLKAVAKSDSATAKAEEASEATVTPPASEREKRTVVVNVAADVYNKAIDSTLELVAQINDFSAKGTGTVVSDKGYFITNAHVVAELEENKSAVINFCDNVAGRSSSSFRFDADLVYIDPASDLALLKTDPDSSLKPVEFCRADVFPGEDVYAIGNSKGEGLCIVDGIVSDTHRSIGGKDHIMISAPVTQGNSGGPVFDSDGRFLGIVRAHCYVVGNSLLLQRCHLHSRYTSDTLRTPNP